MIQIIRFAIMLILLITAWGVASAATERIEKGAIVSEGHKRTYYLFVPASLQPSSSAPLIVLLHGSNRDGLSLVEKWKDLAQREGIILVGPNSRDSSRWSIPGDGPGFLHELVESLKAKYPIDSHRVYLFGHSGGATFALLMSLYESEYFAATAIHAGALNSQDVSLLELAKRKIPIFIQVGTDDPLFPLDDVRATRDLLKAKGFPAELTEIPHHDHWYYDLAPKINSAAWDFLKGHHVSNQARFEEYRFRAEAARSGKATDQYNLGIERQRAGDLAGALTRYNRAIELDPSFGDAYNNRGITYFNQKNYAAAIADFSRCLEIAPSDSAYSNRGKAYFSLNRINEAIADFTEAIKLKASAETYYARGAAYEQTGQFALALADYDRAIQVDPKFARAYVFRGLILLRGNEDATAQKDFDKAFYLDPGLHAEFDSLISQIRANQRIK